MSLDSSTEVIMDRKEQKVNSDNLMPRKKNDIMHSLIEFKYFPQLTVDFTCKYKTGS